jgi:ketosteroid isomerase-like protein
MASANIEFVQSICAAWERGDFSSAEWAHPEIEFVMTGEGVAPGIWRGLAGMAEAMRDFLSPFERLRFEADEYRELDDERVLVLNRFSGRTKVSGMELAQIRSMGASLFHVSGGRVVRFVYYDDRDRALSDLGLTSETSAPGS